MSSSSRRPAQHLNIHCNNCGAVIVRFESFVADGAVYEMVGTKLSEMISFISASPNSVLCSDCVEQAAAEAECRRLKQRERIRQQMELTPSTPITAPGVSEQPATYSPAGTQRKLNRTQSKNQKKEEVVLPMPRRAFSNREKYSSSRYL
jgi:hypothetical protein